MGRLSIIVLFALEIVAAGSFAMADPPGAILSQTLIVPPGMRTGVFAQDRFLRIPPGFRISLWARLSGARFLAVAPNGDVFVSNPSGGRIVIFRPDPSGAAPAQFTYASGLHNPQGLAFDGNWLYVGESNQIRRYAYASGDTKAASGQIIVPGLPDGGHAFKDVAIGPDHSLYVGIGSSCNACVEDTTSNPKRASIYRYNPDGTGGRLFAQGLRNPEGLAFVPGTNTLWAAVNNRDEIVYPLRDATGNYGRLVRSYVDDHPPDLFTRVRDGGNYGWPFCNSTQDAQGGYDNMAFIADFEMNANSSVDCEAMDRVDKGIQAHAAPLGLAFLQNTNFAAPYRNGAAIALHGSWDRTVPSGYKIAWFPWNSQTQTPGPQVDLIDGFEGWGRPVAVAGANAGANDASLLITDDASGAVYKLEWAPSAVSAANGYAVVAPASFATVYGKFDVQSTATSAPPYPTTLGGVSLTLTDSNQQSFTAALAYVSATQINFVVPDGMSAGTASLVLKAGSATANLGAPEIRATAPALFSLSGDGSGVAAAVPVKVNGKSYWSLYGTGIRNAPAGSIKVTVGGVSVPVLYAGAQPDYPALDQINIEAPQSLGPVQVTTPDGISNAVALPGTGDAP